MTGTTTLSRSNPFPSYPVMKLGDRSTDVVRSTGETDEIVRVREVVRRYAKTWELESTTENRDKSTFIPVKGDYGAGKTHLARFATASLAEELKPFRVNPRVVAVATTEVDCLSWYRTVLGPALAKQIDLPDLLTRVMARAAIEVARRAPLTSELQKVLETEPASVFGLLRGDKLNVTEVLERFESIVQGVCADVPDTVKRAFVALPWRETQQQALQFVSGASVEKHDLEALKLVDPLKSEDDATGVIVGIAALCAYLRSPFVFVIDEFEHLARHDTAASSRNATWVKRLLESLAEHGPFVIISGYWSAWTKQRADFGDRFSRLENIRLVKIDHQDVLKIVGARVSPPHQFGPDQAMAVTRMTNAGMRQVMTMLAVAYRESNGFQYALSEEKLQQIADDLGARVTLDTAKVEVHTLFERLGLTVSEDAESTARIPFNLAGLVGARPRVVAKLRHARSEEDYIEQAHEFREQVTSLREDFADAVGMLIADGNADRDYMQQLRRDSRDGLLYYELRDADALSSMESDLRRELARSSREAPVLSDVGVEAEAIEDHRRREQQAHRQRVSSTSGSDRDAVVLAPTDDSKRRFDTYKELSEPPRLFRRISQLPSSTLAIAGALVALLILAVALSMEDIRNLASTTDLAYSSYLTILTVKYAILVMAPLLIALVLWRSLRQIDRFWAYSTRMLRELYVREAPEQTLVHASNILQNSFDTYGPFFAIPMAETEMTKLFRDLVEMKRS